jgi:putative ABC transport system permease protein
MLSPSRILRRLRSLIAAPRLDDELTEELQSHIEMETARYVRQGMTDAAARGRALRDFGGFARHRDDTRDSRGVRALEEIGRDVRFALRSLRARPAFAAFVIGTMAIGIGANTAVFSVANGVILRPLPFTDADNLVRLWSSNALRGLNNFSISPADFQDWRAQNRVFSGLAAYDRQREVVVVRASEPLAVDAARVMPEVFRLLGTGALIGRTLTTDDARLDAPPVAVIAHEEWVGQFGGDSALIGGTLLVDGRRTTVVGVMPPHFLVPGSPATLWTPLTLADASPDHGNRFLRVLGRLAPGITIDRAFADLDAICARLARQYPGSNTGWTVRLLSVPENVVNPQFRRAIDALLVVVAFVLLIACANAANLLLARAAARRKEVAVRTALGASRRRIAVQLLTESFVLATLAGGLGLLLAYVGVSGLRAVGENTIPRLGEVRVDGTVLAFAVAVTAVSGLLFGLIPALKLSRTDIGDTLKEGGRTGAGLATSGARSALVVAQVSLSLVLLVGAGLMMRSFVALQRVELGFVDRDAYLVSIRLPTTSYPTPADAAPFFGALLERARAIPGVTNVGEISSAPFAGPNSGFAFARTDRPVPEPTNSPGADMRVITPGYVQAIGGTIVRGRDFTNDDRLGMPEVVIISETMAAKHWPNEDPIGSRIRIGDIVRGPEFTIVGVIRDMRYQDVSDSELRPMMYFSLAAHPQQGATVVMRATSAAALAAGVREAVSSLDPSLPIPTVRSLEELVGTATATHRFAFTLFGVFAATSLVLAAIGIYGVMAYMVRLRTHEFGIRIALGAPAAKLVGTVLRGAATLMGIGIVIGLIGAAWLTKLMATLLFGVEPRDATTFVSVAMVLAVVGLAAALIPARRATRADPIAALRGES